MKKTISLITMLVLATSIFAQLDSSKFLRTGLSYRWPYGWVDNDFYVGAYGNNVITKRDTAAMLLPYQNAINTKITTRKADSSYNYHYTMGNYYNKLNTMQSGIAQAKVVNFGDSYAQTWYSQVADVLKFQTGGNILGAFFSGSYNGTSVNSTTGSVTDSTADFKTWASGLTTTFTSGGSRVYGVGGSTFNCNKITVFYVLETGAGTFKLQRNGVDVSGFTSVSCVGTLGNLGIATIRFTTAQSNLNFVNLTGTTRIIGVGFEDTTMNGLININISQGGIPLGGSVQSVTSFPTGLSNLNQALAYLQPTMFTFEMKEGSSFFATALSTFFGAIKTSLVNTDVILTGSPPTVSNDTDQVIQNTQLKNIADSLKYNFVNTYNLVGSYAALSALGWQGDGTHVSAVFDKFRGMWILNTLGITNIDYDNNFGTNILNKKTQTALLNVRQAGLGNYDVFKVTPSALDVVINPYRNLSFLDTGNVNTIFRIVASGTARPIMQNNVEIGSGNTRLQGNTGGLIGIQTNGFLSHFTGSTFIQGNLSTTVSSGNQNLSFVNYGMQSLTLTGNIGTISFTQYGGGSETFVVRIIQDATGGRTVAGWASYIKFAGGVAPTLSTSASAVDFFVFHTDPGGNVYEVGRWQTDRAANIINQSSVTQTADYRISGIGTAKDLSATARLGGSSLRLNKDSVPSATASSQLITIDTADGITKRIPIGTSNQVLTVSGGVPSWQTPTNTGATIVAQGLSQSVTGITTDATLASFTTPNDGTVHSYRVGADIKINNLNGSSVKFRVSFTDVDGTSTTQDFYAMGSTTSALTTGYTAMPSVTITAAENTAIAVQLVFTVTVGGVIHFGHGVIEDLGVVFAP